MQTIGTVWLASIPQFGGSCGGRLEPSPSLATAYSYERVSSGLQAEKGRDLDRQANAAEHWCATNGHTLNADLRLSDAGLSAFKGDHLAKGALGRFLDMAQAGDLGAEPILLVEAIDRLSRLEAIDGLQDVLLALVRAGVTIVSLEDGQEYSRTTLREDGSKLIILVVKCQAAHEYSQRLSRRVTAAWDQARDDLGKGILRRAKFHQPPWCRMDGDEMVLIPEGVETIKTVFEYSRIDGAAAVARRLNAEGDPAFSKTGRWSTSIVRKLLVDTRIWGAVTTNQSARLGVAAREEAVAAGKAEQIFPDVLPAALPKEEVDAVLAKRSTRTSAGSENGRRGKWKYAGILVGVKLAVVALVFGLSRAGLDPGWLSLGG